MNVNDEHDPQAALGPKKPFTVNLTQNKATLEQSSNAEIRRMYRRQALTGRIQGVPMLTVKPALMLSIAEDFFDAWEIWGISKKQQLEWMKIIHQHMDLEEEPEDE